MVNSNYYLNKMGGRRVRISTFFNGERNTCRAGQADDEQRWALGKGRPRPLLLWFSSEGV